MAHQTIASKEKIKKVIEANKTSANDTGSPEVQVALLTDRINHLTDHLRKNKYDFSTQLGLMKLVGSRRRMLGYLKAKSAKRYLDLIKKLELRK